MKFYEVFLELLNGGQAAVGKTSLKLAEGNPFQAAISAEELVDKSYGNILTSHTLKVAEISKAEFMLGLVA